MKDRAIWLLALGTIATSVGVSAVVVTALAPKPRDPVVSRQDEAGVVARELAALRAFLEEREGTELAPPAAVLDSRRPADAEPALAASDVERLITAIERLELALRNESTATRRALVEASAARVSPEDRPSEIVWSDWEELWKVYVSDEKAAVNEVRLLTTAQLLARFGPPTEVSTRDNGLRSWYYYEPDGGQALNVTVQIIDDYVTWMWMEI